MNNGCCEGWTAGFNIESSHSIVDSNLAINNNGNGFWIGGERNNTISNNIATSSIWTGFVLWELNNSIIQNNIATNGSLGFYIRESSNNFVLNNTAGYSELGFELDGFSNDNVLVNNTTYENDRGGITLNSETANNTITQNNFIQNNESEIQASDDGMGNVFTENYWSDWTEQILIPQEQEAIADLLEAINSQDDSPLVIIQPQVQQEPNPSPNIPDLIGIILTGIIVVLGIGFGLVSGYMLNKTSLSRKRTKNRSRNGSSGQIIPHLDVLNSIEEIKQEFSDDQELDQS